MKHLYKKKRKKEIQKELGPIMSLERLFAQKVIVGE